MKSEAEVFALVWADEWHKGLEIQKDYNFINLPRLTGYAREFGLSFDEIWFFIRSFQPDRKPLTPIAVNLACKAFVNISKRILPKVGADTGQPPTVELNMYTLFGGRRGDRFTSSGLPRIHLNYPAKIRSLEHFDNSSYDPRASRRNAKDEPESVRRGKMSYLETPSLPPPPVRPAAVGPLHAVVMGNPSVLEQRAKDVRMMGIELNRAEERRQHELQLRAREERLAEREKEMEAERERLAAEQKRRDDEQLAEKERIASSYAPGSRFDRSRAVDYGFDDHQRNAMNNDDQTTRESDFRMERGCPAPRFDNAIRRRTNGRRNAMNKGEEKGSVMDDAPSPVTPSKRQRRAPPVFADGIPAHIAAVVSKEVASAGENMDGEGAEAIAAVSEDVGGAPDGRESTPAAVDQAVVQETGIRDENSMEIDNGVAEDLVNSATDAVVSTPDDQENEAESIAPRTESEGSKSNEITPP
ncbi:hypothetical protein QFC20_007792, partial [Naganishia adeliensis]